MSIAADSERPAQELLGEQQVRLGHVQCRAVGGFGDGLVTEVREVVGEESRDLQVVNTCREPIGPHAIHAHVAEFPADPVAAVAADHQPHARRGDELQTLVGECGRERVAVDHEVTIDGGVVPLDRQRVERGVGLAAAADRGPRVGPLGLRGRGRQRDAHGCRDPPP